MTRLAWGFTLLLVWVWSPVGWAQTMPRACWRLAPMRDVLTWTPRLDHLTPYQVSGGLYGRQGEMRLFLGFDWTPQAVLASETGVFWFIWPSGLEAPGTWQLIIGHQSPHDPMGTLEPCVVEVM